MLTFRCLKWESYVSSQSSISLWVAVSSPRSQKTQKRNENRAVVEYVLSLKNLCLRWESNWELKLPYASTLLIHYLHSLTKVAGYVLHKVSRKWLMYSKKKCVCCSKFFYQIFPKVASADFFINNSSGGALSVGEKFLKPVTWRTNLRHCRGKTRKLAASHWVNRHFLDSLIVDKLLVQRHFVNQNFIVCYFVDCPFVDDLFVNNHFVSSHLSAAILSSGILSNTNLPTVIL